MKSLLNKFKKLPRWFRIATISITLVLVVVHIFLPPVLKYYLNRGLENMDGYYGHIEDVDVSLIRGAYRIEGLHLFSDEMGEEYPLAIIDDIDISIQWKALFKGSLVAEIEFLNPKINFIIASSAAPEANWVSNKDVEEAASKKLKGVDNEKKKERVLKRKRKQLERKMKKNKVGSLPDVNQTTNNFDQIQLTVFRDFLLNQIPLRVNRIAIKNGAIHYIDKSSQPNVDVKTAKINFQMNNLTNSNALSATLIADFKGTAMIMGSGKTFIEGKLDPYDKDVTVDMDIKMKGFQLTELNDLFTAYASFDVDKGEMSLFSEISTQHGELNGYIKPFIDDLSILSFKDDKDESPINFIWQSALSGSSLLTRNLYYNELATKIPLKGNVTEPEFKILNALGNLFLHALFHQIKPKIDAKYNLAK